jgi:hypothetical protein
LRPAFKLLRLGFRIVAPGFRIVAPDPVTIPEHEPGIREASSTSTIG